MPIGKNALKRVINNGYSGVKTTAPDMENSTIEEPKKVETKKAKNPIPKAVTSKTGAGSSRLNPAPKAAILEGMQRIPAVKKSSAKAEPKIIEAVKEETKTIEAVAEIKGAEVISEAITKTKEADANAEVLNEEVIAESEANEDREEPVEAVEANVCEEVEENAAEEPSKEDVEMSVTAQKSMETEPELAPVATLKKVVSENERCGEGYTNLGGKLPYYLL